MWIVLLISGIILLGAFFWPVKPYTYPTRCPRCTGKAVCEVYGSADQFKKIKCNCGYTHEDIC
jgi:hypothetical protein